MTCIHAEKLYTGRGCLTNARIRFEGRTILRVSRGKGRTAEATFPVVTPAFLDAHSHIGMRRSGEPADEGESNEQMDSILALVDALDSVQMDDQSFGDAIEMGVLYSCVVPGSGNLIGGRSAVIRHYAGDSSAALVGRAGLKAALGYNPMSTRNWKGTRPFTRMGGLALLRQKLDAVKQKTAQRRKVRGKRRQELALSAEERVLADVLKGKERLRVHCHKIDDIATLLRLVDAFQLKVTVEHAADVHDGAILKTLAERNIPVVYGPVDAFPYKVELKHDTWRNVKLVMESGCRYGLMTDHPVTLAKSLLLQTRHFLRCGLDKQQAVELVSRQNAELLGVDKVLGTLEKGKWASFVCWTGDPFDLGHYPVSVYGEGEEVYAAPDA